VLGVPWYGYDYPCTNTNASRRLTICDIKPTPYRGAPCSDAAGSEMNYRDVLLLLRDNSTTGRMWDSEFASPWFDYVDVADGTVHQVRFDMCVWCILY